MRRYIAICGVAIFWAVSCGTGGEKQSDDFYASDTSIPSFDDDDNDTYDGQLGSDCFTDSDCKKPAKCIDFICALPEDDAGDTGGGGEPSDDDDDVKGNDDDNNDDKPGGDFSVCKEDNHCPNNFYCDTLGGRCVPGSGSDCFDDTECKQGEICKYFRCQRDPNASSGGGTSPGGPAPGDPSSDDDDNDDDSSDDDDNDHAGDDDDSSDDDDDNSTCVPDCNEKLCGSDGCGGSCGACKETEFCSSGNCACLYSEGPCGLECCGIGEECVNNNCCPGFSKGLCLDEGKVECRNKDSVDYRVCENKEGCTIWSEYKSCGGGQLCRGEGICGRDDNCVLEQKTCVGNTVYVCKLDSSGLFKKLESLVECQQACDNGRCVGCSTNSDCSPPNGICDLITKTCVECSSNGDCPSQYPICHPVRKECVGCSTNADCPSDKPQCDSSTNKCLQCLSDSHCSAPTPKCDTSVQKCVGCLSNVDCLKGAPICNQNTQSCVQCLNDGNCSSVQTCNTSTFTCQCKYSSCGSSCCEQDQVCSGGSCCTPKTCGEVTGCGAVSNGCGGTINCDCPSGQTCYNGSCCTPNCAGKECGSDGCGGTCGSCPTMQECKNNLCNCKKVLSQVGWKNPLNNHCYWAWCWSFWDSCDDSNTWRNSKAECESDGGYLVTFTSLEEQNSVLSHFGYANKCVWLGCTDEQVEGVYKWVTNEPFDWAPWCSGEPNNKNGSEHYCEYRGCKGETCWNDQENGWNTYFICEAGP